MENYSPEEPPPYQTLRFITRLSEKDSSIEEVFQFGKDEFAKYAICYDNDGTISFPDDGIYAFTDKGVNSSRRFNQDGVYANPSCRTIAGADGCGGRKHGESASALFLAGIHSGITEGYDLRAIPQHACRYIFRYIVRFLDPYENPLEPATTAGFAREKKTGEEIFVEGFTGGDYKALVVDQTAGRILYVSRDQTFTEKLVEAGKLKPEEAMTDVTRSDLLYAFRACDPLSNSPYATEERGAQFFNVPVERGHCVITLLYSDGISNFMTPEDVCAITLKVCAQGPEAIFAAIMEELRLREELSVSPAECCFSFLMDGKIVKSKPSIFDIRDNRSIAIMVSQNG